MERVLVACFDMLMGIIFVTKYYFLLSLIFMLYQFDFLYQTSSLLKHVGIKNELFGIKNQIGIT